MPWTDKQREAAVKLRDLYSRRIESRASVAGSDLFNDQEYAKNQGKLQQINDAIETDRQYNRKTDEQGKLTAAPKTVLPSQSTSEKFKGNYNYFFEPSVEEAKHAYRSDPNLWQKTKVDPKTDLENIQVPEREEPYTDPMGMPQGSTVTPAQTGLDLLDESKTAYRNYADYLWGERLKEAQAKGELVQRYRDVQFRPGQKVDYLAGGAEKLARNYGAPAAFGAAQALSLGQAEPLYDAVRDVVDFKTQGKTDLPYSADVNRRSPGAHLAGEFAGYSIGSSPINVIQREAAQLAARGISKGVGAGFEALGRGLANDALAAAGKNAGETMAGKVASSAISGGASNAAEGFVGRYGRSMQDQGNPTFEKAIGAGLDGATDDALWGGMIGGGGEGVGQAIGAGRESFRKAGVMDDLRTYERGGGKANVIYGNEPSATMQADINRAYKDGKGKEAEEMVAQELAPKFQDRLEEDAENRYQKIADQKDAYYAHPEYGARTTTAKPAVDELLTFAQKSKFTKPDGSLGFTDPKNLRVVGDEIEKISVLHTTLATDAEAVAKETGGTIIPHELAREMFTFPKDRPLDRKWVVVAEPSQVSAETIEGLETVIDRELGFSRQTTTKDDPVYKRLNRAVKNMRDQFPLYVDEAGNMVDPPRSMGPSPAKGPAAQRPSRAAPPPSAEAPSSIPSQDVSVHPSETMELRDSDFVDSADPLRSSEIDVQPPTDAIELKTLANDGVGSSQYMQEPIPLEVEKLKSENIVGEGTELGSSDFEKTPAQKAKELNAYLNGPKRKDFASNADFQEARRRWRISRDQGTADDVRNVVKQGAKRQAEMMPTTPRLPEEPAPNTQRSITPDATPLEVMASADGPSIDDAVREPTERVARPAQTDEQIIEEALAPGRSSRSGEAQRMNDMLNQREAYDATEAQLRNVEEKFGNYEPTDRLNSLLKGISQKLGREVTKEDLVRAGLITGGALAMITGDSNAEKGAGAGAVFLGGAGKRFLNAFKKGTPAAAGAGATSAAASIPQELTHKSGGKTRKGLSALRHQQEEMLAEMEALEGNVGGNKNQVVQRMVNFGKNNPEIDDALRRVGKDLGLEKELDKIAALALHKRLRRDSFGGAPGIARRITGVLGPRTDKLMEALAGEPRNPFFGGPHSALDSIGNAIANDRIRELLNLRGGRPGARWGDDLSNWYNDEQPEERANE